MSSANGWTAKSLLNMKPREMYSGAAPAAMAQMGQGLSEAGANIGRSMQQGYAALGQGLSQGISAIGGAVKDYKAAKTTNDITRSMINDPEYGKLLGLDPEAEDYEDKKKRMLGTLDETIKAHGQIGGAQFSSQFLKPIQEYAQIGRAYQQQTNIANIQAETARQAPWNQMFAGQFGQQMSDPTLPQKSAGFGGGSVKLGINGQPMIVPRNYLGNF